MEPARTRGLRRRLLVALLAAAAAAAPRSAAAQPAVLDLPTPGISPPPFTGDIASLGKRAFWGAGKTRWFFSATGEIGTIYLRASSAAGYGKPHWSWFGVEGVSTIAPQGGAAYGGLRFSWPWVDVRAGARYTFTTSQYFLVPRESYSKDDTEERTGDKLRYVTLEAEAAAGFPVPRGAIFGLVGVYHTMGTPPGWSFVEQTLQVVTQPSLLWRGRFGYLLGIDRWDTFRLGATAELIGNPPRDLVVVRAGPLISVTITHHLEAFGAALLVVHSKDHLGLAGGQLGELGLRYRWATGDRWPEFP